MFKLWVRCLESLDLEGLQNRVNFIIERNDVKVSPVHHVLLSSGRVMHYCEVYYRASTFGEFVEFVCKDTEKATGVGNAENKQP